MPNKNYLAGRRREYAIKHALEKEGMIVLRTAGSHGFADLIAFNQAEGVVNILQIKPRSMSNRAKTALQSKISWVERNWVGKAFVMSDVKEMMRDANSP